MPNRVHNRRLKPDRWKQAKNVLWTERAKGAAGHGAKGMLGAPADRAVRHRFMGRAEQDKAKYKTAFEQMDEEEENGEDTRPNHGGGKRRRRKRRTSKKKKSKTTRRKASKRTSRKRRRTRRR